MPLGTQQLHTLQQRLALRRDRLIDELRAEVRRLRDGSVDDMAGPASDAGDESVADLLFHLGNAEIARDAVELRELEAALERMASRSYGECIDCGEEIAAERLAALPTAQRCLQCQSQHEKTFAQPDRPRL
jgi:DnaK suppressor protein